MKKILLLLFLFTSFTSSVIQEDDGSLVHSLLAIESTLLCCGHINVLPEEYTNNPELFNVIASRLDEVESHALTLFYLVQMARERLKKY